LKSKIGFICIGQAGGNIGQLFEHRGYNCLFLNTSTEDLKTLNTKYRFHIPEGEGCNHSREKAIELVKKYYHKIIDEVLDKLLHQDLIYLVFSTGGGTGSGASPILLEMLNSSFPQKNFGCITILPSLDETIKAHINSYQCYQEISNIEKLATVFTLDNNKLDKFIINKTMVDYFDNFISITNHVNVKGNIDKAEIWEQLLTRGNSIITVVDKTNNNLTASIIKSWENNIFATIEKDKNLVYMGLSLSDEVNLEELNRYIGIPYDVFKNYNDQKTVTMLSGLSFPNTRLSKTFDIVNSNKDKIKKNILNSRQGKISNTIDFLDDMDIKFNSNEKNIMNNLDDILSKY
jgi:cell division GTPase FtsZ